MKHVNVLCRKDYETVKSDRVALITGGGSGHEPAHAGFIGKGMLTAVVCGGIFASPSADQVLAAIRTCTGPKGALLIVKNYTGDRLNFGIACEKAKSEGFLVEMIIVGDDVAIMDEAGASITGRRGLAGTLFVHKAAGAEAEKKSSLDKVKYAGMKANVNIGSYAAALSSCCVPGTDPSDRIGTNEMEYGLGIHGEPGREKLPIMPLTQVTIKLVDRLVKVMNLKVKEYIT
jgi:dihydroxyacetone kinase